MCVWKSTIIVPNCSKAFLPFQHPVKQYVLMSNLDYSRDYETIYGIICLSIAMYCHKYL